MVGVTAIWLPVTKSDMDLSAEYKRLRSKKAVNEVLEYTFIFFGLIPYAFAVNQLLVPAEIVGGGLTGLAEILYFADKITDGEELCPLRERFAKSREKCTSEEALAQHARRFERALEIRARIRAAVGTKEIPDDPVCQIVMQES